MTKTGVSLSLEQECGESFDRPHSALGMGSHVDELVRRVPDLNDGNPKPESNAAHSNRKCFGQCPLFFKILLLSMQFKNTAHGAGMYKDQEVMTEC